jgi:hypothetical protein
MTEGGSEPEAAASGNWYAPSMTRAPAPLSLFAAPHDLVTIAEAGFDIALVPRGDTLRER